MRATIGPADAIRAWSRLHPSEQATARIARFLDMDLRAATRRTPDSAAPTPGAFEEPVINRRRPTAFQAAPLARPAVLLQRPNPQSMPWRRYLQPISRAVPALNREEVQGLARERQLPTDATHTTPLLRPSSTALLFWTMAATDGFDGELDIEAVVGALAARQRLEELPRTPRPSLLRGLQILTDVAEAMEPYVAEMDDVVAAARTTVGRQHVEHLTFRGSPQDGVRKPGRWNWSQYRPPPVGTPVLALTELGMAAAPERSRSDLDTSWIELGSRLRKHGSRLLVLTPFPRRRWPRQVASSIGLVHWDRSCTVSDVRRALRHPDVHADSRT